MEKLLSNQDQMSLFDDDSFSLGFSGEVYGMSDNNVTASFFANIYKSEGIKSLCNLNGLYLIAIYDKRLNTFYLINDRYGFKKCYYWLNNDELIFNRDYKHICNHPDFRGHIDEDALADFLYLGFVLEDRTFFREIKLLPAASILTFEKGNISIEKYWDYSFYRQSKQDRTEADYLKEFYQKLLSAVDKRIKGRTDLILPLSGGLDSRTLAGMVSKARFGGKVRALSYGHDYCYDVVYGKKIANALRYPHTFLPVSTDYLTRYAEKFVSLTDGTIRCHNAHLMLFHDFLFGKKCSNVLTGFLGDVLTGTNFNKEWIGNDENDVILKTFEISVNHLDDLKYYLTNDLYERIVDKTIPSIKKYFHATNTEDLFYKAHYLTLTQRQRRYVAFNIFSYEPLGNVLSPFTDNDLVDFIIGVPKEFLMEQSLYRKMIARYLPEVASAPWNKTRLPLNASWVREGLHWRWEKLNRYPLVRETIGRKYEMMNDNYLNTAEAIRTGSKDFVMKQIKENPFLAEYVNMDRIHQMLDDHIHGKCNEYNQITALLTLSLWHRLFIDGNGT